MLKFVIFNHNHYTFFLPSTKNPLVHLIGPALEPANAPSPSSRREVGLQIEQWWCTSCMRQRPVAASVHRRLHRLAPRGRSIKEVAAMSQSSRHILGA